MFFAVVQSTATRIVVVVQCLLIEIEAVEWQPYLGREFESVDKSAIVQPRLWNVALQLPIFGQYLKLLDKDFKSAKIDSHNSLFIGNIWFCLPVTFIVLCFKLSSKLLIFSFQLFILGCCFNLAITHRRWSFLGLKHDQNFLKRAYLFWKRQQNC